MVEERNQDEIQEEADRVFPCGSENSNLPGGVLAAYVQQRILLLIVTVLLIVSVCGTVAIAVYFVYKKPILVFLKNPVTGEVVQVDPSTLKQSPDREEFEIKGFAARWVRDAYTFNPGDVRDSSVFALRYVEPKAQGEAKAVMLLNERADWTSQNDSGAVEFEPDKGRMPTAVVNSFEPLEVTVVFSRVRIRSDGTRVIQSPMALKMGLSKVPRSSVYGNGLMIAHLTPTN